MELVVTAPNRIDLAGGTTDLYPLCLLLEGGFMVNVAVSVTSRVIFRPMRGGGIRIVSEDLDAEIRAASPDVLPLVGPQGLLARAVRAVPPPGDVEILTLNEAPTGSGLGASSALLVAVLTGLLALRGEQLADDRIIDLAASIETAAIGKAQDVVSIQFTGGWAIADHCPSGNRLAGDDR